MTAHDAPGPKTLADDIARLDAATTDLLATVERLRPSDLMAPSRCEGWTRAHVLGHVARNADSIVNLATWAMTGIVTPQYASAEAREEGIETSARQDLPRLVADLRESAARCRAALAALSHGLASRELTMRNGMEISPYELPRRRATEVIVHHFDLATGWSLDHAHPESLAFALEDTARRFTSRPEGPGLTLQADDGRFLVLGDGSTIVYGSLGELLAWTTRGAVGPGLHVEGGAELPVLPSWG